MDIYCTDVRHLNEQRNCQTTIFYSFIQKSQLVFLFLLLPSSRFRSPRASSSCKLHKFRGDRSFILPRNTWIKSTHTIHPSRVAQHPSGHGCAHLAPSTRNTITKKACSKCSLFCCQPRPNNNHSEDKTVGRNVEKVFHISLWRANFLPNEICPVAAT